MFFSHEILQRKSALGQIWIAATMGISRINRRKVQGIDVIQVCSQILEPVTPLALRLSGILMGGLVNVHGRQATFLLEDAQSFLIKLKQVAEQPANFGNSLPRERREARYEAITTVSYNLLDLDYVIEQLRAAPDGLQKDEEELEEGFIYPMKDKSRKAKSKSRSTRSRASSPSSHCQANLEDITLPEASLNLGGNFAGVGDDEVFPPGDDAAKDLADDELMNDFNYMKENLMPDAESPLQARSTEVNGGVGRDGAMPEGCSAEKSVNTPEGASEKTPVNVPNASPQGEHCDVAPPNENLAENRKPQQVQRAQHKRGRRSKAPIIDDRTVISQEEFQGWMRNTSDILRARQGQADTIRANAHAQRLKTCFSLPSSSDVVSYDPYEGKFVPKVCAQKMAVLTRHLELEPSDPAGSATRTRKQPRVNHSEENKDGKENRDREEDGAEQPQQRPSSLHADVEMEQPPEIDGSRQPQEGGLGGDLRSRPAQEPQAEFPGMDAMGVMDDLPPLDGDGKLADLQAGRSSSPRQRANSKNGSNVKTGSSVSLERIRAALGEEEAGERFSSAQRETPVDFTIPEGSGKRKQPLPLITMEHLDGPPSRRSSKSSKRVSASRAGPSPRFDAYEDANGSVRLENQNRHGTNSFGFDSNLRNPFQSLTDEVLVVESGESPPTQKSPSDALGPMAAQFARQLHSIFDEQEKAGYAPAISINEATEGMERSHAARFFYRTLVLASTQYAKVEQSKPYGDIIIRPGCML